MFFWKFCSKNPEKNYQISQKYCFNIYNNNNVSWAANQHVIMISERSRDTEAWSNDAENSALHNRNILYIEIY